MRFMKMADEKARTSPVAMRTFEGTDKRRLKQKTRDEWTKILTSKGKEKN